MGVILVPQQLQRQPQPHERIDDTYALADGLVSAVVFDNPISLNDRVTKSRYPVTSATTILDAPGRVLRFTGAASYVNTGAQTLGGVDLLASAGNPWSVVIYGRIISSGDSGTFIAKCGATAGNRQFQIYRDVTVANADPGIYIRGALNDLNWDYNTELWHQYTVTWDGTTAKAYGDEDRSVTLTVGAAAAESENIVFGARTGGAGFLLNGQLSYAYLYNRAISREESIRLYRRPWQVFKARTRRIWISTSGGGPITYNQSLAGSLTPAGALTKRTNKNTAGLSTFSGSIVKLTTKTYAGSMTAAGAVAKRTTKAFAGSITGSGALGTMILFTASLAGSLTPAGALSKLTMKALAGSSTLAGAITKKTFRTLDGNITVAGALTKLTKVAMAGSVTVAGVLTESYQVLKSLAGSITPAGALATVYTAFVAGVLKLLALMGVGQ